MTESSITLIRIFSLLLSTGLFAATWANDQPATRSKLAKTTRSATTEIVSQSPSQNVAPQEAGPVSKNLTDIASPQKDLPSGTTIAFEIQIGQRVKSIRIEGHELLLSEDDVQAHLEQLPIGLASGNYRIVDSMGGIGWLRVESSVDSPAKQLKQESIKTLVAEQSMQFIYINEAPSIQSAENTSEK
ncbi:hypothetical protein SH668x_002552 [Planctomicrobium sp. SH668]|uniref:hypothetical protein n=1 Tax=Planctomicrobium sp. SH668 TaxID=3448126 RepID=UPI003F5C37BA